MAQADWKQIMGVLLLFLAGVQLLAVMAGQRRYAAWRRAAEQRGWRFQQRRWGRWHYRLAGTTVQGAVWEMYRVQQGGVFLFRWRTFDKRLPYGKLLLLPQGAEVQPEGMQRVLLGDGVWQTRFVLLATHQLLGERYVTGAVRQVLAAWPLWPQPGALESVVWDAGGLVINGRFHDNWETIDRMVALGTALLEA